MGPFLGPGEDLTIVARGTCPRNLYSSNLLIFFLALALLPAILETMQTVPVSRQDGAFPSE